MSIGKLKEMTTRDLYLLMAGFEAKLRNGGMHCNQAGYKYAYMHELIIRDLENSNDISMENINKYLNDWTLEDLEVEIGFNILKNRYIELYEMENISGVPLSDFKYYNEYMRNREALMSYYLNKIKIN